MKDEIKRQVEEAKEVLQEGGTVIYPTETAYGIAADALDPEAVEKVYEVKQRPREKKLTVIVDSLESAERYAELTGEERRIVETLMPGPLTLVADRKPAVPDVLNDRFVFRVPDSEVARELAANGPMTATSANISGQETSYRVEDIDPELRDEVDYIIDAGTLEQGPTSTIAEVNNGEVVIHRKGPVTREEIEEVL
ncbi:MAG: L-threonylcarbamoyladenylate synthase [Candidatus Nanohaloarchaea archaeon]